MLDFLFTSNVIFIIRDYRIKIWHKIKGVANSNSK